VRFEHLTDLCEANFQALTKQGIQLTNYFAVTHPSEPNYISTVGGEYFGMQNDNLSQVPANVSTIVDLLEEKGISWAEYQEDIPSSGFPGFQFLNAKGQSDYVRKHKWVRSPHPLSRHFLNAVQPFNHFRFCCNRPCSR